ncbi:hypothetical protein [Allokutzneria albata]|uniref:hypothetical protein n=1 Tax=Allokutzneria albata TaxID=211114 RepID=UPI0012DC63C7|nr:hypothetical protein [Allokutzneria albata]
MDENLVSAHSNSFDPIAHVLATADSESRLRLLAMDHEIALASELEWERHYCRDTVERTRLRRQ